MKPIKNKLWNILLKGLVAAVELKEMLTSNVGPNFDLP